MKRRILGAFILIFLSDCLPTHSQNTNLQPAENVHIDGLLFYEALRQVATTYRTVIGLVDTEPPPYNKPLNVKMDHATLAETLDALVKADPRYSWQRDSNGVVLVSSRNSHTTLPDLAMSKFNVENLKREEISELFDNIPEISEWTKTHACPRSEPVVTIGMFPEDRTRITFVANGRTLRENLDEVVLKLKTYYWIIGETATENGCVSSIVLPAPDIPRRTHAEPSPQHQPAPQAASVKSLSIAR